MNIMLSANEIRMIEDITKLEWWRLLQKHFTEKADSIDKKIVGNVSPWLSALQYNKTDLQKVESKVYRELTDIVNAIENWQQTSITILRNN